MVANKYDDLLQLMGKTVSAVYILAFVGKKTETTWIGKIICYCGRYSYEIMALHVIGLLIGNKIVESVTTYSLRGQNTYDIGYRYDFIIMYMFLGVSISLLLRYMFDYVKNTKERIRTRMKS